MNLIAAIVMRELLGWPRHPRFYVKRLAYVASAGAVVLSGFSSDWLLGPQAAGVELFGWLAQLAVGVACIAAPATASTFFAREHEMRTLDLLLLAPLTPTQLVLCRLLSGLFATGVTVLGVLPLFILCLSFGGLSTLQIAVTLLILLATVCLGTCLGLLVSVLTLDEMMAFCAVLVCCACLFVLAPVLVYLLGADMTADVQRIWFQGWLLPTLSPVFAVRAVFEARDWLPIGGFLALATLLSAGLLALTVLFLPHQAQASQRAVDPRFAAGVAGRRRRRPIAGNPLVWKESGDIAYGFFGFSVAAAILLALPIGMTQGQVWLSVGLAAFSVSALITGLGLLLRGALAFAHEKESRTFELLLISGLDGDDIIMGKYWGYLRNYTPWLVTLAAAFLLLLWCQDLLTIALTYLLFLTLLFAYFNLSFLLSLLCKRMTALLVTLFLFLFWVGAGTFLILNLERYLAWTVGVVVVHLVAGLAWLEVVFRVFQRHTSHEKYLATHYASSHHWSG